MRYQLISFNTAVEAKEKGFSEKCPAVYNIDGVLYHMLVTNNSIDYRYGAAEQPHLKKWLREKHKIHITIDYLELSEKWAVDACFYLEDTTFPRIDGGISNSYEDALEIGLYQALKLIEI